MIDTKDSIEQNRLAGSSSLIRHFSVRHCVLFFTAHGVYCRSTPLYTSFPKGMPGCRAGFRSWKPRNSCIFSHQTLAENRPENGCLGLRWHKFAKPLQLKYIPALGPSLLPSDVDRGSLESRKLHDLLVFCMFPCCDATLHARNCRPF